ncbi:MULTISPECIES: OB-fold domain-containing protein [Actinomycetes]|uniref:Zn-ribbon domain-containing OB-fold protein n=1 Tax=Actinomycetes TaxID=1760 RepID=UPI000527BE35|nr:MULTISPECIES: OB-fold domain-containing protein [Actinomycetes]
MEGTVVDETLFAQFDPPVLAGSGCSACAVVVFPATSRCPSCADSVMEHRALPIRGTVWTWTSQSFAPKPPYEVPESGFEPFVVGYIDLGSVLVESRILGPVVIGDEVELRLLPLAGGDISFAFEKVAE